MKTEKAIRQGGCQCGRIRYRVSGQANNTANCHCRQCRLAAGAAFMTFSEFPTANVQFITGEQQYYRSSDRAERGFCPTCGTAISFRYDTGDAIDIATATFDDPGQFPPQDHLWTENKVPWLVIGDKLPQHRRGRD